MHKFIFKVIRVAVGSIRGDIFCVVIFFHLFELFALPIRIIFVKYRSYFVRNISCILIGHYWVCHLGRALPDAYFSYVY